MIKLLVSIIEHNSYQDTINLINSILNKIDTSGYEINFFIVDNGHKKNQSSYFDQIGNLINIKKIQDISELKTKNNYFFETENHGFGAANNIVIDYINISQSYDLMWLVNTDLTLDYDCLSSIRIYVLMNGYDILGSVIFEPNHIIYGTDRLKSFKGYEKPSKKKLKHDIFNVDAVSGTSMFVKTKILEKIKFDEEFFMYVEENDFCYRALTLGISSYIVQKSVVYHSSGRTFGKNQSLRWYYKVRNLLYFKKKHNFLNLLLLPYLFFSTLNNFKFSKQYLKAYYFGVFDYLTYRMRKTKRKFD